MEKPRQLIQQQILFFEQNWLLQGISPMCNPDQTFKSTVSNKYNLIQMDSMSQSSNQSFGEV